MTLNYQIFIDDSSTPGGEFVLAGHIAPAEAWAKFSTEWETLLPMGTLSNEDTYHFKMSQMALTPERMERAQAFYRVIEKYVTISVSIRMNLAEFKEAHDLARETLARRGIVFNFKNWTNPYFFLCRSLLDEFHRERENIAQIIPLACTPLSLAPPRSPID